MKVKVLTAAVLLALFLVLPMELAAVSQDTAVTSPAPAFSPILGDDSEYRILIYETLSEDIPAPLLVQQEQPGQMPPEQNQPGNLQGQPGPQPGEQNQPSGQQGRQGVQPGQPGGPQGTVQTDNEGGGWGYYWWWWIIIAAIIIFFIIIFAAWGGWGGRRGGRPPDDRV